MCGCVYIYIIHIHIAWKKGFVFVTFVNTVVFVWRKLQGFLILKIMNFYFCLSEKSDLPSQKHINIDLSCERPMDDAYNFNTDYV